MSLSSINIQPLAVDVSCNSDKLQVTLADGREIAVPLEWYPRLLEATPRERNDWQLLGGGLGIHWEGLDEDVTVESLLRLR
ncbi:MAG TPA: DUF2442 domain-containing protein [Pyrinomonadaceae bacterium]|nr:DUF2442 domain-containing protein [Pyrinomonadaceae bacterium]